MKRTIGLFGAALFILFFVMTNTVGAASLDKPLPSKTKEPVKVEKKGDLIYEWYDGASPVKIPSEKEVAKRQGKKGNKRNCSCDVIRLRI